MLVAGMPQRKPASVWAGYSLIQLLVVITLLGTLVTMAIPSYRIFVERARQSRAIGQVAEIDIAIHEYSVAHKAQLPVDLGEIGFAAAVDPWGAAIEYVNFSLGGAPRVDQYGEPVNTSYDLYSAGPDGVSARSLAANESQDDIVLAGDGAFVGAAAEFSRLE